MLSGNPHHNIKLHYTANFCFTFSFVLFQLVKKYVYTKDNYPTLLPDNKL